VWPESSFFLPSHCSSIVSAIDFESDFAGLFNRNILEWKSSVAANGNTPDKLRSKNRFLIGAIHSICDTLWGIIFKVSCDIFWTLFVHKITPQKHWKTFECKGQYYQMSHEGGMGPKIWQKMSRIIWKAPLGIVSEKLQPGHAQSNISGVNIYELFSGLSNVKTANTKTSKIEVCLSVYLLMGIISHS